MANMTLRKFCERYRHGDFSSGNLDVQIEAGWCDWFCKDKTLSKKLAKIWQVLDGITSDYVLDNYRVCFYNRCPVGGHLYDDISFNPINNRDELHFIVSINDPGCRHRYTVSSSKTGYMPESGFNDLHGVHEYINGLQDSLN